MKYFRILSVIIVSILITVPIYSKQCINFRGTWGKAQRSFGNELPVHACIEDTNKELSLFFDNDLGDIYITISDSFGIILYNQVVNTNELYSFAIPIKDMEGEYILSITSGKNNIFGQFSIN